MSCTLIDCYEDAPSCVALRLWSQLLTEKLLELIAFNSSLCENIEVAQPHDAAGMRFNGYQYQTNSM